MTSNLIANQINRDDQLTSFLCGDVRHIRVDLEAWIRDELNQSIQACNVRLEHEVDGPLKEAIAKTLNRLRHIDDFEFSRALDRSKKTNEDIESGEADNVFDGYDSLIMAQSDLLRIGRELLDIRNHLASITD